MLVDEYGRFLNATRMYALLADYGLMRGKTHIALNGFAPALFVGDRKTSFGQAILECKPGVFLDRHNAKARIFVHCGCGRKIPFGRMGQHTRGAQCHRPQNDDTAIEEALRHMRD